MQRLKTNCKREEKATQGKKMTGDEEGGENEEEEIK